MLNREPDAVIKTKPGKVMKVWVVPFEEVPEGTETIPCSHPHLLAFYFIVLSEADDANTTGEDTRAAAH